MGVRQRLGLAVTVVLVRNHLYVCLILGKRINADDWALVSTKSQLSSPRSVGLNTSGALY
jgi:hypothetical protein